MYFISQNGQHDCAFACLAMMLANYHHDKNYLFLKHDDRAFTYKELITVGECYNLHLLGVKVSDVEELRNCKKFPIIVTLEYKNKVFHSVLLYRVNKKYVYYFDPNKGKKRMLLSEFGQLWNKKALVVDNFEKTKCPVEVNYFIAKKDKITLPILQVLSGLSLLVGTYFVNSDTTMLIPIILFTLFVIFEILFRDNLIKAMRRLDDNINRYEIDVEKENYFDFYMIVENYRKNAMTLLPNIIYTMLLILFAVIILIMNGLINLIYIVFAFSYSLLEYFFITPYFNNKSKELENDEQEIKQAKNKEEFNHYVGIVRNKAYSLGLYKTITTYISVALILFTIILVMVITQNISLTYVLFYLCTCYLLKTLFTSILSFSRQEEICDNYLSKIISSLKEEE